MARTLPRKEEGRSQAAVALGVFLAAAVGFVVYEVLPFYYYYYDLKSQMQRAIASAAVETDEEIRRSLMAVVKRHGIVCGERDLQVARTGDAIKISLQYKEPLTLPLFQRDVSLHDFEFNAEAEGRIR